jgi:hypothetical protein
MNKISVFIAAAIMLASAVVSAQSCNCESNFEWVKKTFEENDAGFQYAIDTKGEEAYDVHNQQIAEKIKNVKTLIECRELLHEWLQFFRSCHIGIYLLQQTANETIEYLEIDIPQFEKYIETKTEADYEGIWKAGNYKIGIKKEDENYIGFIIEADIDGWREQGLVKMKIKQEGKTFKSTWYMLDHTPSISGEPELIEKNHLQIGRQSLKRINPIFPDDPLIENYLKSISSQNPFLEELSETTLYLRIPSFNPEHKPAIDKLIADNKEKILKTENMIIDLRNNSGGSDISFNKLIPFLYTKPIKTIGLEFLSTELNYKQFLEYNKDASFLAHILVLNRIHRKIQKNMGEFVNLFGKDSMVYKQKIIYEYPKNVGIIINRGCASTTEQFLLSAKQSEKMKMFGTATRGCLDISNMASVESPCKELILWYAFSKDLRLPENAIDEIGIQPDIYIDETIPQYKWVEFVNEALSK